MPRACGAVRRLWRRIALVFATCAGVVLASAIEANACTCLKDVRLEPCGAFWTAEEVFEATVLDITPVDGHLPSEIGPLYIAQKIVRLTVHRSWKGVAMGDMTEVITNASPEACGFDFEVGRRYIVFADSNGSDGPREVTRCGPTRPMSDAAETLGFLTALSHPALGGEVFGSVEWQPAFYPLSDERAPLPSEVSVQVIGAGTALTTTTEGGRYRITGLSPGHYRISAVARTGEVVLLGVEDFEISGERSCAMVDAIVEPAGRLNGRLADAQGVPIAGALVVLEPIDGQDLGGFGHSETESDGTFEITGLPPGSYRVRASLMDRPLPIGLETVVIDQQPLFVRLAVSVTRSPEP
jgi:hypothetical protein